MKMVVHSMVGVHVEMRRPPLERCSGVPDRSRVGDTGTEGTLGLAGLWLHFSNIGKGHLISVYLIFLFPFPRVHLFCFLNPT